MVCYRSGLIKGDFSEESSSPAEVEAVLVVELEETDEVRWVFVFVGEETGRRGMLLLVGRKGEVIEVGEERSADEVGVDAA